MHSSMAAGLPQGQASLHARLATVQSVPVCTQTSHGGGEGPQHSTGGGSAMSPQSAESEVINSGVKRRSLPPTPPIQF